MRVWDTQLTVEPRQIIMMPYGAVPLKVIVKGDVPWLYYQVPEKDEYDTRPETRVFRTICAGEQFAGGNYIDSFVLNEWFVGHVYEAWDTPDPIEERYADDFRTINYELKLNERVNIDGLVGAVVDSLPNKEKTHAS